MEDSVNSPKHYNSHPSGVECIIITEHMSFNVGNAIKYLWRAGMKISPSPAMNAREVVERAKEKHVEDLRKASWYIEREITRLGKPDYQSSITFLGQRQEFTVKDLRALARDMGVENMLREETVNE